MTEFLKHPIFLFIIAFYAGIFAKHYPELTLPIVISLGLVMYFWKVSCKDKE